MPDNVDLRAALQGASLEEITAALVSLDQERPGLAYDVGMKLYEMDVGKTMPGRDPGDYGHPRAVLVRSYDESRREDAIAGFRDICDNPIPDPSNPKWLKATRTERRAVKRAARDWPGGWPGDRTISFMKTLDFYKGQSDFGGIIFNVSTRAEAESLVARWAAYGVTAVLQGFEEAPKTHRVSMRDLSRGPTG